MKPTSTARSIVYAVAVACAPGVSLAATPTTMLEKSQSYAHDNIVRAFSVPTRDSNGKIKYYDLTIELMVNNDGTINPLADVTSTISPVVSTRVVQPGTYKASDGATCTVTNMTLTNGRIQSFFACTDRFGKNFELSFATGTISNGHPYLSFLQGLGVDKLTDSATYTWGRTTNGTFYVGTCGTFNTSYAVGAKTNGSQLNLTIFGSSASQRCQATFTKQ